MADLDCRLLPGTDSGAFLESLRSRLPKEDLEYFQFEILQDQVASVSPIDSPLYQAIEKTIRGCLPKALAIPFLTPGFTDAHYYRKLGMTMYGFIPMEASSGEEFVRLIHGHDERISLKNIDFGVNILMELTKRMLFEA
jgi:acetylornithine deacetylase/succinyl-diaminopimelate desuccinylase-like protein